MNAADRDEFLRRSCTAVALARATPGCLDFVVGAAIVDGAAKRSSRGAGPDDGTGALVHQYQVAEYVVTC
jgi:hypothetical protein